MSDSFDDSGYISTVQDILDLAERLKRNHHPDDKILFTDSDFNQYSIGARFQVSCVGDVLGLDELETEENGEDYTEKCISFNVD